MLKTLLLLQSNLLSVALYIGLSRASPLYIYIGAEKKSSIHFVQGSGLLSHLVPCTAPASQSHATACQVSEPLCRVQLRLALPTLARWSKWLLQTPLSMQVRCHSLCPILVPLWPLSLPACQLQLSSLKAQPF